MINRAKWKGPYVQYNYLNLQQVDDNKKKPKFLMSKNSEILPKFVGLDFKIYNGKKYVDLTIYDTMIGHKFGEFIPTRAKFNFKKKSKKKKK